MYVIHLLRKPLGESSIAKNCEVHGSGALNIDGARLPNDDKKAPKNANQDTWKPWTNQGNNPDQGGHHFFHEGFTRRVVWNPNGRFPANVILAKSDCAEECPAIELEQKLPGASSYFKQVFG